MVLSAILALSVAAPSGIIGNPWASPVLSYSVPSIARVGSVVSHVPTSVSQQSSSVVHSTGSIVTPVITPIQKTIVAAPIHAPLAYSNLSPLALSASAWNPWNQPLVSGWNQQPLISSW